MIRVLLLGPLVLAGCPKQAGTGLDPLLPEKVSAIQEQEPVAILEAAAEGIDPSPRARALRYLILTSPEPAGGAWGLRGLYDPDAWVQRAAVEALLLRMPEVASLEALHAFVSRDSSDPYVRSHAAVRLPVDPALGDTLAAAVEAEPQQWRKAPLALGAIVHGHQAAEEPLAAALKRGEVALEIGFLLDVGRHGGAGLLPALKEGTDWLEDEMVLPYAVARVALGDPSGEQELRRRLSDGDVQGRMEALDYLARMGEPEAVPLLRKARNGGPDLVRAYADLCLAARGLEEPAVFLDAMSNPEPEIRALAVRFAGEALDAGVIPRRSSRALSEVLKRGVADEAANVRTLALMAVAAARLEGGQSLVTPQLSDDFLANRVEAAGAMLRLESGGG